VHHWTRSGLDEIAPISISLSLIIAIWMQTGRLAHGQPQDSLAGESAAAALRRTIEAEQYNLLNRGQGQRLLSRLNAAEGSINGGRTATACNEIGAFITEAQRT
jgi:hypothetical protein